MPDFDPVNERTSARYTATLEDEAGTVIDGTTLTTLTLTVYDVVTNEIINGRNAQNVLNVNGVTVSSVGALVWTIEPDDTVIIGSSRMQVHVALFIATWDSGTKACTHEVRMTIRNLNFLG